MHQWLHAASISPQFFSKQMFQHRMLP
uniref:Uncharacterized protein n=1 Tax=Arundo donax TaxID=35708 RepID=A0A0A9BYH9_ARUDO